MPMEFMLELSQGDLPRTVDDARGIDCVRVLAAAHLVQAVLPEVGSALQSAQVLAITAEGRAALRKAYPERDFRFLSSPAHGGWHAARPVAVSPLAAHAAGTWRTSPARGGRQRDRAALRTRTTRACPGRCPKG